MLSTLRTVKALFEYEASIVPHARREIRRWARAAATIPNPALRHHATDSIAVDGSNAEAVAAFAAVAPQHSRRSTVELLVAYQILVDYVDALGERVCAEQLVRGLRIGMALAAATAPPTSPLDLVPLGDDGGYVAGLVTACRVALWQLPSVTVVERQARIAALRCGEALAHTHTAARRGTLVELRRWAAAQPDTADYAWWEIAAGGNSSIAILALLATAADPVATRDDADAVAGAYWPHVCVISTMLDSLVDYERDTISGDFSFVSHYPDRLSAQRGLIAAASQSLTATRPLRHGHRHMMIVCGVAGYYAAAAVRGSLASEIAPRLLAKLRPTATPIILALRVQHRLGASRR
jgi:tetraprenyl-beta-curcumene synthase